MIYIKTNREYVDESGIKRFAHFKSYKDLLKFMQEENLNELSYEVYLFTWDSEPLFKMDLHTIKDVENIVENKVFCEFYKEFKNKNDSCLISPNCGHCPEND